MHWKAELETSNASKSLVVQHQGLLGCLSASACFLYLGGSAAGWRGLRRGETAQRRFRCQSAEDIPPKIKYAPGICRVGMRNLYLRDEL